MAGKRRTKRDTSNSPWQTVVQPTVELGSASGIRRLSVIGGWLYQVARHVDIQNGEVQSVDWHAPVFVPGIGSSDGGAV